MDVVTWQNWYENTQWVQNLKHIQVLEKLVYHPHKDWIDSKCIEHIQVLLCKLITIIETLEEFSKDNKLFA